MSKLNDFEYMVEDYGLYCTSKNLSQKTLKSYDQTLKLFAMYLEKELGITSFEQVETTHIRHYIRFLQERGKYTVAIANKDINRPENRDDFGKQLSPYTINNYIRNIKVFFNFMVEERFIRRSPAERIKYLKEQKKIKEAITRDELKKILNQFDVLTLNGHRDFIITKLLVSTGARIGETLSLTDDDIDWKNGLIIYKDTKNKKEKVGYLTGRMSYELRRWINFREKYSQHPTEWLFPTNRGTQLKVTSFGTSLRRAGNRAGIANVHAHRLRATFAIEYLRNGGSIYVLSRLLDHSSIETTKIYLNMSDRDLRKEFLKYHPKVEVWIETWKINKTSFFILFADSINEVESVAPQSTKGSFL